MTRLLKYRYHALAAVLFALMVSQTLNGIWGADFWEHSAIVRELATNPLHPHHPQLLLDAPHAFSSPYLLAVALIARFTGLTAIQALSVAAILNLLLLLAGLWLFLSALRVENLPATAFYTLLFLLLLLGPNPPRTSGFFHLRYIGMGLPYPSTFAVGLALVGVFCYVRYLQVHRLRWFVAAQLTAVVVLLTHPLSFIFLAAALFAFTFGRSRLNWREFLMLGLLYGLSVVLAALWPYYPFLQLVLGGSRVYDAANYGIYLQRVSLAISLLGLPFLFLRAKKNWRDPLVVLFVAMAAVYVFGYLSQRWSYGRAVSSLILILDIALADAAGDFELRLARSKNPLLSRWIFTGGVFLACVLFSYKTVLLPGLQEALPGQPNNYASYEFLSTHTGQYDVVLSDINTSWFVPTFGGKIVAAKHPLAFVPDEQRRVQDVDLFFKGNTDLATRWDIIRRYQVDYLLLNKTATPGWESIAAPFLQAGKPAYEDDHFLLVSIPNSQ